MKTLLLACGVALLTMNAATAQQLTNLSVAWRICEQNGRMLGRASLATGPARWVFAQGYGACESVQKLIPSMRSEKIDPNKTISDQMLIEKALRDPNGKPQ